MEGTKVLTFKAALVLYTALQDVQTVVMVVACKLTQHLRICFLRVSLLPPQKAKSLGGSLVTRAYIKKSTYS